MASKREKAKREIRIAGAREAAERSERVFESTALNIPKGMKQFKFEKAKTYRLDFLPYIVGEGNPGADKGFMYYTRKYYTHPVPTPDGIRPYCCLKQTFGRKKCPVCDEITLLRRQGKTWEETKGLHTKERSLFQVYDLDVGKEEILLFEINHWQFGRLLEAYVGKRPKYDQFFHFDKHGYTIEVDVEEEKFEGKPVFKPTGAFTFQQREEEYTEEILDQTKCLDEIPKELTYDALRAIFLQLDEDGNPPPKATSAPTRNGHTPKQEEEDEEQDDSELEDESEEEPEEDDTPTAKSLGIKEGMTVKHKKHGVCTVSNISGDGRTVRLTTKAGKRELGIKVEELEIVKTAAKPKAEEPDDDDEDQGDSDLEDEDDSDGSDLEEDEDEDSSDLDDDDEEPEDEPVAKKKPGKK